MSWRCFFCRRVAWRLELHLSLVEKTGIEVRLREGVLYAVMYGNAVVLLVVPERS